MAGKQLGLGLDQQLGTRLTPPEQQAIEQARTVQDAALRELNKERDISNKETESSDNAQPNPDGTQKRDEVETAEKSKRKDHDDENDERSGGEKKSWTGGPSSEDREKSVTHQAEAEDAGTKDSGYGGGKSSEVGGMFGGDEGGYSD